MAKQKDTKDMQEVITFKTKDNVTVRIQGKPNFEMWAKKMIDLYDQKQNKSAS